MIEQLVDVALLDDAPGVHDDHAVRRLGDHSEVVGHDHHGGADALAHLAEELEDLCLDRHVERRRRLVGDDHLRRVRQCEGDRHPLAHAAGELHRVLLQPSLRIGDADGVEQIEGGAARRGAVDVATGRSASTSWEPVLEHGVERRHRVLEHEADAVAADAAQPPLFESDQLLALESCRPGDPRRGRQQPEQGQHRDALARTGLSDDAEHLTGTNLEGHAVDGAHRALIRLERDVEIVDVEQRRFARLDATTNPPST